MSHDEIDSERDPGETYSSARDRPSFRINERLFLAEQAGKARAAIVRSSSEIGRTLAELTNFRRYVARHPWIATGSAAATGVAAGALIGAWRAAAKRTRSRRNPASAARSASPAAPTAKPNEGIVAVKSLAYSIAGTVLAAVVPPLMQMWFAPVAGTQQQQPTPLPDADRAGH